VQLARVVPGAADDPFLVGQLGFGEWEQIKTLGFAADRDRAVTARAMARLELGRRLGVRPSLVSLLAPEVTGGRPVVRNTGIGVSWSHSSEWVALALTDDRPVGVDIEFVPEEIPVEALRRFGVASLRDFVAREAAGKATGEGLAVAWPPPVRVVTFKAPHGYVAAVAAPGGDWSIEVERLDRLEPPASASAAATGVWDVTGIGSRRRSYSR
jgi:phosphopantetheinyl transferase